MREDSWELPEPVFRTSNGIGAGNCTTDNDQNESLSELALITAPPVIDKAKSIKRKSKGKTKAIVFTVLLLIIATILTIGYILYVRYSQELTF